MLSGTGNNAECMSTTSDGSDAVSERHARILERRSCGGNRRSGGSISGVIPSSAYRPTRLPCPARKPSAWAVLGWERHTQYLSGLVSFGSSSVAVESSDSDRLGCRTTRFSREAGWGARMPRKGAVPVAPAATASSVSGCLASLRPGSSHFGNAKRGWYSPSVSSTVSRNSWATTSTAAPSSAGDSPR